VRAVVVLAAGAALIADPAAAQVGNAAIPLKMKRGTDSLTVHGVLKQNVACCSYVFAARAGQQLHWRISGPAVRMTISYPDGHTDGPGIPNPLPLPASGHYVLGVTPDLMADGAFGRFTLTIRIPPK
jgi:hypothetical protein